MFFLAAPAPGLRASHMAHSYDFFKPHLSSPYPVVDGKGSAMCYLRSLDTCYQRLAEKRQRLVRLNFVLAQLHTDTRTHFTSYE